jgi:hypothetical protein
MPLTVDQAAQKIHNLVQDDGFWGTSRNDHMHEVRNLLKQYSPADANAIVSKLSEGDLKGLAEDVNSGGIFGAQGLSGDEKRDMFNDLAKELDGSQLGRLANAFSDRGDVLTLSDSVATFGSGQAKVDYIKAIAGRSTDRESKLDSGFGYSSATFGDKEAIGIGKVLSSLKNDPASFNAAVTALSPDQLASVVKAGEGERMTTYSGGMGATAPQTTFDPAGLRGILDAAANSSDPVVKARVFDAATTALSDIRGSDTLLTPNPSAGDSAKVVAEGLTKLMDSDTRGIVNELNNRDASGKALTTYLQEVIKEDPNATNPAIGRQIAALQGAGTGMTAAQYINTPEKTANGDSFYRNAQNLGYYAGAVQAGINKMNADDKTKGDILSNVFSTAITVGTTAITKMPVSGKIASGIFNGLTREAVREVVADVSAGRKSLRDALSEMALPKDPGATNRYRGPADPFFQGAANTVVLANQ